MLLKNRTIKTKTKLITKLKYQRSNNKLLRLSSRGVCGAVDCNYSPPAEQGGSNYIICM